MVDERSPSYEELAALVVEQARTISELRAEVQELRARVAELERQLGQNSGNSGKPPSRDSAAERQRQAAGRKARAEAAGGGKQRGAKGKTLEMSETPDEVVEHRPEQCSSCGSAFGGDPADQGFQRRQLVEVPPVRPVVIEHRVHIYRCGCGAVTTAPFPSEARAPVAIVATQTAWAAGLAALVVEINNACHQARASGAEKLSASLRTKFSRRYDELVSAGLAANPEPAHRKRDPIERRSYNLAAAFAEHKRSILRFMNDLDTPMTNNEAERALRPSKLHRKISGSFRSLAGAERSANLRSYLDTTRKNGISAIDTLMQLFGGQPWMPPLPA